MKKAACAARFIAFVDYPSFSAAATVTAMVSVLPL
jgi:hypothetical protein